MSFEIPKITKPFENYKWRWMEYTPVESFNRPDILIGVARAMSECEGMPASDDEFINHLQHIQNDLLTDTNIKLVPHDKSRNVIRRQGRYWRGLGILDKQNSRSLKLTEFGKKYANGSLTNDDFIASIIKSHEIPNSLIENEKSLAEWRASNIKIKPLELILNLIRELAENKGFENSYLTPEELSSVIIPLVIFSQDIKYLANAVIEFRLSPHKFSSLPNCATKANDKRMVREHLMILSYFGVLQKVEAKVKNRFTESYYLGPIELENVNDLLSDDYQKPERLVGIKHYIPVHYAPTTIRTRKMVEITSRPNQARFRKALLANFNKKCLITGEVVNDVLIACHIHEVKDGGSDHSDNGIILRSDLHILFDKNKLRISQNGDVIFSPDISVESSYVTLPKKVEIPKSVNLDLLRRRFEYGKVVLSDSSVVEDELVEV
jgi:hypothetical protein